MSVDWPPPKYFYVMDAEHNIRCVDTMDEWAQYYEADYRQIDMSGNENIFVSTIFLGLNHNWGEDRETNPILFETMVFGGHLDGDQYRWYTYNEAMAGHKEVVTRAFIHAGVKARL